MKSILTLALKDLKLQTRDWFGLFWMFLFPLMLALFFGSIFSGSGGGGRTLELAVIDEVNSKHSREFLERLGNSTALKTKALPLEEARAQVSKGKLVAFLRVKSGFGDDGLLFMGESKRIELGIDPARRADSEVIKGLIMEAAFADLKDLFSDPGKALAQSKLTLQSIEKNPKIDNATKVVLGLAFTALDQFLEKIGAMAAKEQGDGKAKGGFSLIELDVEDTASHDGITRNAFEITFPSSILWGMMGCLASFAIALVVERREGTFLRLRTAPLTLTQLLAGKGLACFLACCTVTVALLGFAVVFLGVRLGNVPYLILAMACTSFCFTGIMMFVSTLGKTEQSVAGAGWGIMMPMAMLGGGMVPLVAMPPWMLTASHFSPMKWGILAFEGAIWRRFTFGEMLLPCAILLAVGAVGFGIGVAWLRKQEG